MPLTIVHSDPMRGENSPRNAPPREHGGPPVPAFATDETIARIGLRLQHSLDPGEVVQTFAAMVASEVPHDGMSYTNAELGISIAEGHRSHHSCTYDMVVEEAPIGEITLCRGRRFSGAELDRLEQIIAALAYPLRNAVFYQRAERFARQDPLTGLYNRTAMDELIGREISLARRNGVDLSLLVIDIDCFKQINDMWGHRAGDIALMGVADSIRKESRETDLAFRFGGEEFLVILPGSGLDHATQVAERLRALIEAMGEEGPDAGQPQITVSIGVTSLADGDTMPVLLHRADRAMYAAKGGGRNRIAVGGS